MNAPNSSSGTRKLIAIAVLVSSVLLLVGLCSVFIYVGGESERPGAAAEKAFATLIPLIGTWIGTVLAYYFSGENFQRATDSVTKLASQVAEERLRATPVSDAMIPIDVARVLRLQSADPDGAKTNLKGEVLSLLSDQITRIPILDQQGRVKFILHGSLIHQFISDKTIQLSETGKVLDVSTLTLKDLLDHDDNSDFAAHTIAFVGKNATLAEAKQKMESVHKSQDVFVTEDGTAKSRAIGWITNVILSKHARA